MRRNVIRQGNKSYTVTLPVQWVREQRLEAGSVDIMEMDGSLVIDPANRKQPETKILLNISTFSGRTIRNVLNQYYRKGFDKLEITYKKPEQLKQLKQIAKDVLLGFEVTQESESSCIIQNLAEPSYDKYEIILKKIFFIIKTDGAEIADDLHCGHTKNMERRNEHRQNVDSYTNFIRRSIIRHKIGGSRDACLLYYFVAKLSIVQHAYFYLYKFLREQKKLNIDKKVLELFQHANEVFDILYQAYYKQDVSAYDTLESRKEELFSQQIFPLLQILKGPNNVVLYYSGEIIRLIQVASTIIPGLYAEATG